MLGALNSGRVVGGCLVLAACINLLDARESAFLQAVGGKRLTIEYDRAPVKLTPGKVSPLGQKIPARLTSEYDFAIGDVLVSEGTYSLFALPSENGWKLIVNRVYKDEEFQYDPKEDAGRFDMELSMAPEPSANLAIAIVASGGGKGKIKIECENTTATLGFSAVSY